MHWFSWNCDSSVTQRVSELDTRDFCNLNESQLFLIEFYSVPGAWVMMLVMLMVERLGLAVMTSRLVAEMGSWGQESCQSLHTSVPPASSPQGQSSLDNTSSVIRTRLVRADSSTMAIRSDQTLSHCHTVTLSHLTGQVRLSSLSTSLQSVINSGRNVSTNQMYLVARTDYCQGKNVSWTISIWTSLVDGICQTYLSSATKTKIISCWTGSDDRMVQIET